MLAGGVAKRSGIRLRTAYRRRRRHSCRGRHATRQRAPDPPELRRTAALRQAQGRPERSRRADVPPESPVAARAAPCRALRGRNGEPLTPFCAASFQIVTAILRGHPDQEAVRAPAPPAIRLKRAFALHADGPLARRKNAGENLDSSEPDAQVSNNKSVRQRRSGAPWGAYVRVASLRQPERRRVSPRSFPQLWKKMWKSPDFRFATPA